MTQLLSRFLYGVNYLLSLLPMCVLYLFSDVLYYPLYYVVRYRRKVVRKNLLHSFPDKPFSEIVRIEKEFYAFLCDYFVETTKLYSISKENLMRRMSFSGVDDIVKDMEEHNFCFVYLGHYGNWEWIASLPYWVPQGIRCGQIYHPLRNKAYDRMFLQLRNKFGGECIAMKETLRRIIELRNEQQKIIIGFISDQSPKKNSIHHWIDFLHQDTPVFTGTEKIGKQVGAIIYYADVSRPKRGHYHCSFKRITTTPKEYDDFQLTDIYMRELEKMISEHPSYWLWSHNRWKRTRDE